MYALQQSALQQTQSLVIALQCAVRYVIFPLKCIVGIYPAVAHGHRCDRGLPESTCFR